MTQKDYKLIANVLHDVYHETSNLIARATIELIIEDLCVALVNDNSRFNVELFCQAVVNGKERECKK